MSATKSSSLVLKADIALLTEGAFVVTAFYKRIMKGRPS
jgi:hypothetical protein